MDKNVFDFELKHPITIWNREVSIDFKEFFSALGKTVVSGVFLDYKGVCENLIDSAKSAELAHKPASVLAWELINTALLKSVSELVLDSRELFEEGQEQDTEELAEILYSAVKNHSIGINSDFFDKPQEIELFKILEQPIIDWLMLLGISKASSYAIFLRLKDRFALNLHSEWSSDPTKYSVIEDALVSPFLAANKEIRSWTRYRLWLQQEANKPIFSEAFGLQQVYIPLRGYYKMKPCQSDDEHDENLVELDSQSTRLVVDVHKEIDQWVYRCDTSDPVKVISGGPGSGKSSFAKVLAAKIAKENPEVPVLFIPLHHFDIDSDLNEAVDKFVAGDRYLNSNPLSSSDGCSRLLVIFDGLDELSMRGKAASDSAVAFVEEVINQFNRYNAQDHRRQAIITGRDMAVQSSSSKLRKSKQILNLLPYFTENRNGYTDPENLLEKDLRNDWWIKYGKAKGLDYEEFPLPLHTRKLDPITTEPLLNYLVALTYEGGRVDFSNEVNLNTIYSDLLEAVHQRQWDHGNHKSIDSLDKKDFLRILEEIALAVWHGHGRTATSESILSACENARLTSHLEKFQEGSKKGISRLLTAFYFRESDSSPASDNSFEFTHKSFGEYLISKRIVRQLSITCKLLAQNDEDPDFGKDEKELLLKWTEICGPNPIDEYIYEFLKNEIDSNGETAKGWHSYIKRLIESALIKGIPVDTLQKLNFSEMKEYSNNALESLFILQNFCIDEVNHSSDRVLNLRRNYDALSEKRRRVSEQLSSIIDVNNNRFRKALLKSLTACDFSFLSLNQAHLSYANLSNSVLRRTQLQYIFAIELIAKKADFTLARMNGSVLKLSNLENSYFIQTSLRESIFVNCNLTGTNFKNSKLIESTLLDVNAFKSNFTNVRAQLANFSKSNFECSNFSDSIFTDVNFSHCNLSKTNFVNADLSFANLSYADLRGADLTGANINGAKLISVIIDKNTKLEVNTTKLEKVTLKKLESLKETQKKLPN
ncbi:pentapeptide repeat-containing protein [Vibrio fortis]|uniref:Pentapeptide repeat-containing protein n=1 Tax=Vibrio fortis TaxID=212667 RepID=A0A5N3RD67_9VIBR|nr:pentapeptide repeat-containing protein [Vibrio fortis]KAB0291992.1 pentapeptide repeat-containing protein [Vibrio fortis]